MKIFFRKKSLLGFIIIISFLLCPKSYAQDNKEIIENEFYQGKVISILASEKKGYEDSQEIQQKVQVQIKVLNKNITASYRFNAENNSQELKPGDLVVVNKTNITGKSEYYIYENFRLKTIFLIFLFFLGLVILFSGKRGFFAVFGLLISIFIIYQFIVPSLFEGKNPFLVGLIGAFSISVLSIYTSHGLNKRTSVALLSTLITLTISIFVSAIFVSISNLFGLGSEEAFFLQNSPIAHLDLRGLLLCGIIIGTLGVLDDVTTAQVAAVDEIRKANLKLKMKELYTRGLSVGREHILSMVNTLVLAYSGTALPLFMLFLVYQDRPFWVILNSEFISEEIIRTISGSIALVLAVPISTFLAAYILPKTKIDKIENREHIHFHG